MKIALVTDTHFGHKNDSLHFHDYFIQFYDEIFFPTLRERGINTIIHLGDLFDRRKYINFHILHRTRIDFLQKIVDGGFDFHVIIGNHDTYFRDSNNVNSVTELLHERYPNFHVYEEPQEILFDKLRILIVPWLNSMNMGPGMEMIANSKCRVLLGHLEIKGFHMDRSQISEHGMERDLFGHFKKVFSGHFHHPSEEGVIRYLGSPYEMTFSDLEDPKGFYIFDTDTLELEFIQNPHRMFYQVMYDDQTEQKKKAMTEMDFSKFEDKFVRIYVVNKTDPVAYEVWLDKLVHANPADYQINDKLVLEVGEEADEQFLQFDENNKIVVVSDTLTVLNNYVDAIGIDVDKPRMKEILRELYVQAIGSNG